MLGDPHVQLESGFGWPPRPPTPPFRSVQTAAKSVLSCASELRTISRLSNAATTRLGTACVSDSFHLLSLSLLTSLSIHPPARQPTTTRTHPVPRLIVAAPSLFKHRIAVRPRHRLSHLFSPSVRFANKRSIYCTRYVLHCTHGPVIHPPWFTDFRPGAFCLSAPSSHHHSPC